MGNLAYIEGRVVPLSEARIAILDRGFLYGDGLFETIRIYQNMPFLLEKHLRRLLCAAKTVAINAPSIGELESAARRILAQSEIQEGVLKIIITRGSGERGLRFSADIRATLVMILTAGIPYTEGMYQRGFSAVFVPDKRALADIKSLSCLVNVMANSCAQDLGAQEALFLKDGFVTEGTMSNVFVAKNGRLMTPSLEQGILPGITRELVLRLAGNLGIEVCEASLKKKDAQSADEVFVTNSIIEIMPVVRLEKILIGDGMPGELTCVLRRTYQDMVKEMIANRC